jgi:translocation and assembly module TamB
LQGTLSANVKAHGTQLNPIGQGTINLSQAKVSGETIQAANVKFQGTGDAVHANLEVRLPAGAANGVVTYYPKSQGYEAQLKADGIQLAKLEAIRDKNLQLQGTLNLDANGRGTIDNPQLVATVQIPSLILQNQKINGLTLQTNVANHVANLALDSQALNTNIRGRATVSLTGDYQANATIDTQPIPLAPLVAVYAPEQAGNLTGQTELHGTLRGPLKQPRNVEAHFTIPTLAVNYQNKVQIGAPQPIRFDYVNGVLDLQRSALKGTDTDLQFQGRVPLVDKTAPVSVLLLGTIDLRLLQLFDPDVVTSGQLSFDINSFGQLTNPNVQGQVRVINAAFATGDAPLGLSEGNGVLTLTRDRLDITSFNGKVGGGNLSAKGAVLYRPNLSFDLMLQGRGIRLLYPDGVRSGIGTTLYLTGTTEAATLRGQVNLNQLSFTQDFDLTSMMGQFGGTTAPPPAQGFSNNLQLDIQVRSTQGINLVSRQLSIDGSMNLNVKGTAAQPVVLGRINLNGGDFLFNNERFVLQGGTIDFVNPSVTQPVLNVAVNTTVQQYNVAMRFEGPVDHMRTSYSSDPALPPADIIHLIAFGSTTESAAANPSPPGNLAAEQKIASAVSGQVTSRVAKIAGLSQLSIDPTLGGPGTQSSPGATITVQQRVTSKIFVTFSTDVTSTQNQVIQLEYKPNRKFSFSGTRDQNGGVAFDTRIHKTW